MLCEKVKTLNEVVYFFIAVEYRRRPNHKAGMLVARWSVTRPVDRRRMFGQYDLVKFAEVFLSV